MISTQKTFQCNSVWEAAQQVRDVLHKSLPEGLITAEHTSDSHHYRFDGELYDSVTTKTGILDKGYLKKWAIKLAIDYIRDNASALLNENTRETVLYDASIQHEVVLEEAGDIGTLVHNEIEDYINNWILNKTRPDFAARNHDGIDSRVTSAIKGFYTFLDRHYIIPISSELLVASKKLSTGGTMDFICYMGKVIRPGTIANCFHDFRQRENFHECEHCSEAVVFELTILDWKTSNSIKGKTDYALQTVAYGQCVKELTGLEVRNYVVVRLDKKNGQYELGRVIDPIRTLEACEKIFSIYDFINQDVDHLQLETKEEVILNI